MPDCPHFFTASLCEILCSRAECHHPCASHEHGACAECDCPAHLADAPVEDSVEGDLEFMAELRIASLERLRFLAAEVHGAWQREAVARAIDRARSAEQAP